MRTFLFTLLIILCLPVASARLETEISLTFGGDCVLGTREEWMDEEDNYWHCVQDNGLDWSFNNISDVFKTDDITLINLECVFQDDSSGHNYKKQHTFRGSTSFAAMLPLAGIELVNIANNHYIDYNLSGERSTKEALEANGVAYCGYRNLYIAEKQGIRIGFGGCRESVWLDDKAIVYRDIQKLKKAQCNIIIYSCHWGQEYASNHNNTQKRMAEYAVNSGADIIVGRIRTWFKASR